MKQVGNTILAKGVNHILAKRDNSAWPKGAKLSGFSNSDLLSSICYPDYVIHLCLVTLCFGWYFERDTFCRITFEFVHHIGIHLSSGKIAMGKQLAHGVDVCSLCQL